MLTIYRRHLRTCPQKDRSYKRCRCPLYVYGSLQGQKVRKSLDLTSWEAGQELIDTWARSGKLFSESFNSITPETACTKLLSDLQSRHVSLATLNKYQTITKQLVEFCKGKGINHVHKITLDDMREFRGSWKDNAISAHKKLERVKAMFRFFLQSKWVAENYAQHLKQPIIDTVPTMPFTPYEMELILNACDSYPTKNSFGIDNRARIKALVLLLRYSGLRITDAVCIQSNRIADGKLFLYTQKTGVPVHLPLPPFVLDALERVRQGTLYFWTGKSNLMSAGKNWQRAFRRLFKHAGITEGHPHRFRDTFAVELLQKGVSLDMVSILLGHSSIKITEKHYAPWIRARQEQLENAVRLIWTTDNAS